MSVQVHIENVFPSPIYHSWVDVSNIDLSDVKFQSGTPDNNLMLSVDDFLLNQKKFSDLKNTLTSHMRHFYYNVLGYSDETYPEMTSSWVVRSKPGQGGEWHVHTNAIFSGVLYTKTSENCGKIAFSLNSDDIRHIILPLQVKIETRTVYNDPVYTIKPRDGLLVLFPASMRHKVEMNLSNEDRYSIAFNFFLKGNFSVYTARMVL